MKSAGGWLGKCFDMAWSWLGVRWKSCFLFGVGLESDHNLEPAYVKKLKGLK
jgi:hypothetical protein